MSLNGPSPGGGDLGILFPANEVIVGLCRIQHPGVLAQQSLSISPKHFTDTVIDPDQDPVNDQTDADRRGGKNTSQFRLLLCGFSLGGFPRSNISIHTAITGQPADRIDHRHTVCLENNFTAIFMQIDIFKLPKSSLFFYMLSKRLAAPRGLSGRHKIKRPLAKDLVRRITQYLFDLRTGIDIPSGSIQLPYPVAGRFNQIAESLLFFQQCLVDFDPIAKKQDPGAGHPQHRYAAAQHHPELILWYLIKFSRMVQQGRIVRQQ